jgi:hypothetical protein
MTLMYCYRKVHRVSSSGLMNIYTLCVYMYILIYELKNSKKAWKINDSDYLRR